MKCYKILTLCALIFLASCAGGGKKSAKQDKGEETTLASINPEKLPKSDTWIITDVTPEDGDKNNNSVYGGKSTPSGVRSLYYYTQNTMNPNSEFSVFFREQ